MENARGRRFRGRVESVYEWLGRRVDSPLGRLSLQWFRAYFEASRNSGCAISIYSVLSVFPAALVFLALVHPGTGVNAFAERIVDHMHLTGSSADLVRSSFGSTSSNALGATIAVAITFLLWGIGIGQIYQDVFARAWRISLGSLAADQGMFAVFFFVFAGSWAGVVMSAESLRAAGWLVLVPVWVICSVGFWSIVPHVLLHRKVGIRALLPGALLSSIVIGGTIATSPLFMGPSLNENGRIFGSFGVVATVIGYIFIMLTMSLVCGVFSPVWAEWRRSEKARGESERVEGGDVVRGTADLPGTGGESEVNVS
jgi:membrane protein